MAQHQHDTCQFFIFLNYKK